MTHSESHPRYRSGFSACVTLLLLALLPIGCGERAEESSRMARRTMTVDTIPEVPKAAAEKALPEITFEDAWANVDSDGEIHSFELRGRTDNGRIREVRVSLEGEVLEME